MINASAPNLLRFCNNGNMRKFIPSRKVSALTIVVVLVTLVVYFVGKSIPQESISEFVRSTGPYSPIVFIAISLVSYVFAPVIGAPFLIAGFYLFGPIATIYLYFTAVLGSTLNFLIAKKWGRPVVAKLAGKNSLEKIDRFEKGYGLLSLIFLRVFLSGMGDYVSYAYGLTPMKFKTFFIITSIFMFPPFIFWYFVSKSADNINQFLIISYVMLTIVALGTAGFEYLRKRKRRA